MHIMRMRSVSKAGSVDYSSSVGLNVESWTSFDSILWQKWFYIRRNVLNLTAYLIVFYVYCKLFNSYCLIQFL